MGTGSTGCHPRGDAKHCAELLGGFKHQGIIFLIDYTILMGLVMMVMTTNGKAGTFGEQSV